MLVVIIVMNMGLYCVLIVLFNECLIVLVGLSFGEYVVLIVVGVLLFVDGLKLVVDWVRYM